VDAVGSLRGEGRTDAQGVPRLLQGASQSRGDYAVARYLHAVFILHGKVQVSGAHGTAHVGGGEESVEEEAGAARARTRVRVMLQRRGRERRRGAVRALHSTLTRPLNLRSRQMMST